MQKFGLFQIVCRFDFAETGFSVCEFLFDFLFFILLFAS